MIAKHDEWIRAVADAVGGPPRGVLSALRRHGSSKPPGWLKAEDLNSRIDAEQPRCVDYRDLQGIRVQIADEFTLARVAGTVIDHTGVRFIIGKADVSGEE